MADPAWNFRSYAKCANPASDRRVERHYETLDLDAIKALPVKELAHPDGCHLFLWVTGPHLLSAAEVMTAWGFRYSGVGFTWVKLKRSFNALQLRVTPIAEGDLHVGLGFTTRKNAEFCLLGRRGNARRLDKTIREIILAPVREHSRKPDEAFDRAMRYCAGPYLELFSREDRAGWSTWGNETGKFSEAA
jgi:N6-adenosine-specific RNA methylase IME4